MVKKVIDFNRLPKQEYIKPAMEVVEIQQKCQILVGSFDEYNMNKELLEEEEVLEAW